MVRENALTCLMVTHNMQQALDLGSRTLMMNYGKIVLDVAGEERAKLTVRDLTEKFHVTTDRMLL